MEESVNFYLKMGFTQIVSNKVYARFESSLGDATFSLHAVQSIGDRDGVITYFEVASVDSTVRELKQLGFVFEKESTDQEWLWTEAYLRDPSGNLICLYHAGDNRKNPPWRIN